MLWWKAYAWLPRHSVRTYGMDKGLLTNSGLKAVCDPAGQGGESDYARTVGIQAEFRPQGFTLALSISGWAQTRLLSS